MEKYKPLRWTQTMIAREFGMDSRTIGKRLAAAELKQSKTLNTQQVCRAIFGDIDSEKLRLTREQADKIALENAEARKDLVPAKEFQSVVTRGIGAMLTAINSASNIEREDKDKIIRELRRVGEAVVGMSENSDSTAAADGEPMV